MIRTRIIGTSVEMRSGASRAPSESSPCSVACNVDFERFAGGENCDVVLATSGSKSARCWSSTCRKRVSDRLGGVGQVCEG